MPNQPAKPTINRLNAKTQFKVLRLTSNSPFNAPVPLPKSEEVRKRLPTMESSSTCRMSGRVVVT